MQLTEAPVLTSPRTGMPSTVSWPEMGGPTAQSDRGHIGLSVVPLKV